MCIPVAGGVGGDGPARTAQSAAAVQVLRQVMDKTRDANTSSAEIKVQSATQQRSELICGISLK